MYDELKKLFDDKQVDAYLQRLNMVRENPTLEYLNRLIHANLLTVPYENATVWAQRQTPSLATDDLFEKIVVQKRGGYCFELNIIFNKLIIGLGFTTYMVTMAVGREGLNGIVIAPAHAASVVIIDGNKYFVDVCTGVGVDGALPMDGNDKYGRRYCKKDPYDIIGKVNPDGTVFCSLMFKDLPCDVAEMIPLNFYISNNPDSRFKRSLFLIKNTETGRYSMFNGKLRITDGENQTEIILTTIDEIKDAARKYYDIPDLPMRKIDWEGNSNDDLG